MDKPTQPKRRKHHRLTDYDYSLGGIYFITLCLQHRLSLFGEIIEGEMLLDPAGQMVERIRLAMPDYNPGLVLDCHVVMPNHFHAVIGLIDPEIRRGRCPSTTGKGEAENETVPKSQTKLSLHDIVRKFKTLTGRDYGQGVRASGWKPYDKQL